ncbi:DNA adenine methylase, partial [Campylobacter canadensis]|uniref:DNA adenine methylase n=1 Tax=Campylobacter canadensis TaxID=449520 RepID=UPI001CCC9F69
LTPFGRYKKPLICDEENIVKVHKNLKNVIIKNTDYKNLINDIDNKTFIYFDPPYRPLNKTSSFISYFNNNFDDNEQIRLADFIEKCNNLGARFLLSNSDPKNINKDDDFFDELYRNYIILRINATRCINSKANNRGAITELIIKNY